jgi:hypothetical protein
MAEKEIARLVSLVLPRKTLFEWQPHSLLKHVGPDSPDSVLNMDRESSQKPQFDQI